MADPLSTADDLTGRVFGCLEATGRTVEHVPPRTTRISYKCKCQLCGRRYRKSAAALLSPKVKLGCASCAAKSRSTADARAREVAAYCALGYTCAETGGHFGLTRQRVHVMLQRAARTPDPLSVPCATCGATVLVPASFTVSTERARHRPFCGAACRAKWVEDAVKESE